MTSPTLPRGSQLPLNPPRTPITLRASPKTSIWRKPSGQLDVFNAPHRVTPPQPLSAFTRARVTVSADWVAREDNAGLVLIFWPQGGAQVREQRLEQQHEFREPQSAGANWVYVGPAMKKHGAGNLACVHVVSCEHSAADACTYPRDKDDEGGERTTVEVRVEKDVVGHSLWVYYLAVDAHGGVKERHPVRELGWMFSDGWERNVMVQVGVYAALPAFGDSVMGKELVATFENLQIEWTTEEDDDE